MTSKNDLKVLEAILNTDSSIENEIESQSDQKSSKNYFNYLIL